MLMELNVLERCMIPVNGKRFTHPCAMGLPYSMQQRIGSRENAANINSSQPLFQSLDSDHGAHALKWNALSKPK
jgi:hypothetical protein